VKSLVWLAEEMLHDCGIRCGVDPSRDRETIKRRVENEGLSFLTITLPSFCKGFEEALSVGRLDPSMLPSFRFHRGLPVFLRGFLSKIFHTDHTLRDNPDLDCILSIRQICLLFKKVKLPCTEVRERKAEEGFVACEYELGELKFDEAALSDYERVASIILGDIVRETDFGDPYDSLVPRHGPGTTQEKILGNAKYRHLRWHSRLEEIFPFTEFAVASQRNIGELGCPLNRVEFVEPGDEEPVRVVFVPKTLKSPRVIAIEPVCMQYMQQSILQWLVPLVERSRFTGGRVNFTDQSINQRLARQASIDGSFATLDLSEASDRVHLELVTRLLSSVPRLRDMVMACRSTRATLPSGKTLTLHKFASMGSALCFPMEALAFFTAIVSRRIRRAQRVIDAATVREYSRDVYVYGDDIIVPVDEAPVVCDDLSLFGLKVNRNKSFWTGKFRESCGMDAYAGVDVTPVYCRTLRPANKRSQSEVLSWVSMANQFYKKGFWHVARHIRNNLDTLVKGGFPHVSEDSQGVGWVSYSNARTIQRWHSELQRFEFKTLVAVPRRVPDHLDGDGALLKYFLTNTTSSVRSILDLTIKNAEHLVESVRRGALTLKLQWVPSY